MGRRTRAGRRTPRLGRAISLAGLCALFLSAAGLMQTRASAPAGEDRRLVGDWETPDAFLVADQALWRETLRELLDALRPAPVYLLGELPGDLGGEGGIVRALGLPHQSAWVRDYGPIQVRGQDVLWLDADYYPSRERDDAVPRRLAGRLGMRVERVPYALEGGGIASDGGGLCVMTEASFGRLTQRPPREADGGPRRGNGWRRQADRRRVADRLGCARLVAVPALSDEPTGHVDMILHFLAPEVIAVGSITGTQAGEPGGDAARLDRAAELLSAAAAEAGRQLEVIRVPIHRGPDGALFSFLNLLHTEDALIVPRFRDVPGNVQAEAYRILGNASGKRIVPVSADDVLLAAGGLHCIALGLHLR